MKTILQKWLPAGLMLVMALWFLGNLAAPKDKDFAFTEFGQLPLTANGRVVPLDSLARNSLLAIREKQTVNTEPWKGWNEHPKIIPATEWLANVMMNPAVADNWPVFRVDNPDLVSLLKLPDKGDKSDGKHYSWNQIQPAIDTFEKENERVQKVEAANRTAYENAIAKMHERLTLYAQLKNSVQPADAQDWPAELSWFEQHIPDGIAAAQAQQAGKPYDKTNFTAFVAAIERFQFMANLEPPLLLPPNGAREWRRMGDALLDAPRPNGVPIDAAIHDWAKMAGALAGNQPDQFNAALRDLRSLLVPTQSAALDKARAEVFFNQMQPFYGAMVIYILAGLLAIFSWFGAGEVAATPSSPKLAAMPGHPDDDQTRRSGTATPSDEGVAAPSLSETLRRSSVWLVWLAFVIHTTGLVYRMVLEGRPPVTNLYSSAIFIGWGAVLLGLILEKFHRNGIGLVVASVIGFITLIIAHHLALEGDTMEMMRAVLDTNFWLATHVVSVTIGYASTYVAGFLALIYILRGVFTKTLDAATGKSLARMIYGIVCFATLFSFVGTVLGGIWADQSWGRFWGWDPKENGALIIVLWNALILHLRWGGLIRERGLVNCAIFGNIVTAWSWFGVNMLGIGLHSYGFTEAAFQWLVLFVVSQLAFIGLGLLPLKWWKSHRATPAAI
jgi:ABC-type transport system involved in cytochrome c biogenesis permease subunit